MQADRFEIHVPQVSLDDLKARLARTRHAPAEQPEALLRDMWAWWRRVCTLNIS